MHGGSRLAVENLVLPKIESEAISQKYGKFVVGPLERGYGVTVGNSLRRVLLSSLPGSAVTSIRVTDVSHEFSPIPHVLEDMMQLIMNIKQLRFILNDVETSTLSLEVHGSGTVTAADIIAPPEVEIVNPEQYLFTVDSDDAFLEIEMTIDMGRGYSPAEARGRLPINVLPVDAIYSPIRRVAYDVQKTRVGQSSDYDKVILEVWTDGTIKPEEAVANSAQIMMQQLIPLAGVSQESLMPVEEEVEEEGIPNELYDTPIESLDLSVRVFNSLKRTGITKIGELIQMLERGEETMLAIRNFGEKSLDELKVQLRMKGYLPAEE